MSQVLASSADSSVLDRSDEAYRELSKSAVVSVVSAVMGLLAIWHPVFLLLPLMGVFFGFMALMAIRRYPDEVIGKSLAISGLVACSVLIVFSIATHSYIYATEVPENHTRMSFADLKPNKRTQLPYSEKAVELDGQKVFIRGYVRPGARKNNLKNFVLVGDFGQCCFGGNPEITDVVAISIVGDMTTHYSWSVRRISGTFRLNPDPVPVGEEGVPGAYYLIEADNVW